MKDGYCPKCSADAVYMRTNEHTPAGVGSMTVRGGPISHAVPLTNYVCARCGYVELYLEDQVRLDEVAANWTRVASG